MSTPLKLKQKEVEAKRKKQEGLKKLQKVKRAAKGKKEPKELTVRDEVKIDTLQKLFDAMYASKDKGDILKKFKDGKIVMRMITDSGKIEEVYTILNDGVYTKIGDILKFDLIVFAFRQLKLANFKQQEYTIIKKVVEIFDNPSQLQALIQQFTGSKVKLEYYEMFSIDFRLKINDTVSMKKSGIKPIYIDIGETLEQNDSEQKEKEAERQEDLKMQSELADQILTEEEKQNIGRNTDVDDEHKQRDIRDDADDGSVDDDRRTESEEEEESDDGRDDGGDDGGDDANEKDDDLPVIKKKKKRADDESFTEAIVNVEISEQEKEEKQKFVSNDKYRDDTKRLIKANELELLFNLQIKDLRGVIESSGDWNAFFKNNNEMKGKYQLTKTKMDEVLSPEFRRDMFIDISRYQIDTDKTLFYYTEQYFLYCDAHVIEIPDKYPNSQLFAKMIDEHARAVVEDRLEYIHVPILNATIYKFAYNYFFKKMMNGKNIKGTNPLIVDVCCESTEPFLVNFMSNLDTRLDVVISEVLKDPSNELRKVLSNKYVTDRKINNLEEFQNIMRQEYVFINYSYTLKECVIRYLQRIIAVNIGRDLSSEILDINLARFMIAKEALLRKEGKDFVDKLDELKILRGELDKLRENRGDTKHIVEKINKLEYKQKSIEVFFYGAISKDVRKMKDKDKIQKVYSIFSCYKLRKFMLFASSVVTEEKQPQLHDDASSVRKDILSRYTEPVFLEYAKRRLIYNKIGKPKPEISSRKYTTLVESYPDIKDIVYITEILANPIVLDWSRVDEKDPFGSILGADLLTNDTFKTDEGEVLFVKDAFFAHLGKVLNYINYRIDRESAAYRAPNIKTYGKPVMKPLTVPKYQSPIRDDIEDYINVTVNPVIFPELIDEHRLPLYFRVLELNKVDVTSEDVNNAYRRMKLKREAYDTLGDPGSRRRYTITGLISVFADNLYKQEKKKIPQSVRDSIYFFISTNWEQDYERRWKNKGIKQDKIDSDNLVQVARRKDIERMNVMLEEYGTTMKDIEDGIDDLKNEPPTLPYYIVLGITDYEDYAEKVIPDSFTARNIRGDMENIEHAYIFLRNDVRRADYVREFYAPFLKMNADGTSSIRKKTVSVMNRTPPQGDGLAKFYYSLLEEQDRQRKLDTRIEDQEREVKKQIEEQAKLEESYQLEIDSKVLVNIVDNFIDDENIKDLKDLTMSRIAKYLKKQGKDDTYVKVFEQKRQEYSVEYQNSDKVRKLSEKYTEDHKNQYLAIYYERTKNLSLDSVLEDLTATSSIVKNAAEGQLEYRFKKNKEKFYNDLMFSSRDVLDICKKFIDMDDYSRHRESRIRPDADQKQFNFLSTSDLVQLDDVVDLPGGKDEKQKVDKDAMFNRLLDIKDAEGEKSKYSRDFVGIIVDNPGRFRKAVKNIIETRLMMDNDNIARDAFVYAKAKNDAKPKEKRIVINDDDINDIVIAEYISEHFGNAGNIALDVINDPAVAEYVSRNFEHLVKKIDDAPDDADHCVSCLKKAAFRTVENGKEISICSTRCIEKFAELKRQVVLPGRKGTESVCKKYMNLRSIMDRFGNKVKTILSESDTGIPREIDKKFLSLLMKAVEKRIREI